VAARDHHTHTVSLPRGTSAEVTTSPPGSPGDPAPHGLSQTPLAAHLELRDAGVAPANLAEVTVASILEGRFYVYTHPGLIRDALTTRVGEILEGTAEADTAT
jgi:hypothetical protein